MIQPDSGVITILIPTYNRRDKLQKALESVLQETRVPLEVHVFDNASTDDTELYVTSAARSDSRVRYVRHPTNVGAVKNYKFAFHSVRTEYFLPLADDDYLLPDFLFSAWTILQQQEDLGAAIFVTEQRNEAGELLTTYPTAIDRIGWGRQNPAEHLRDLMIYGHYAWHSILWRSEVLTFMEGNYFCAGLASDVDFQLQIFCKYPAFLVNQSGAVYLTHGQQASRGFNIKSVSSWASLIGRLDRAVREFGIFEPEEYFHLRSLMLGRYRGAWQSTENISLRAEQVIRVAALAGFRLGDWDFAYSLLAELPADKLAAKATLAAKVAVLPSASLGDGTAIGMQTGRFGGALFPTLLWLKESRSHVRLLNAKVGSLESRLTSTFQEHQAHIERVSGALQETQAQLSGAEKTNAALTAEIASRRTVVGLLKSVLRRLADRKPGL